jgi:hypothetical protein
MTNKKDDAAKVDGGKAQADPAATVLAFTREDAQEMIDVALSRPIADLDFPKMVADAVSELAPQMISEGTDKIDFAALIDQSLERVLPGFIVDAIGKIDWDEKIDRALAAREARLSEQAAVDEKAARDAVAAGQRKAATEQKRAAKAVEDAELVAEKKRMAAVDRARREYVAIVGSPVPTALAIDAASSIELRLADGGSFMPGFEIGGITAEQLPDESGRAVLNIAFTVAREAVGFTASEAILIVEGGGAGDPLAVYRAELMPPVRIGGGVLAEFPAGSFAFRRLSPLPEAAAA